MSWLDWLNHDAFGLFHQEFKWNDVLGNLLGLAALALGWRRSIVSWPVQLLSGLVLISANYSAHLSGGVGKQLVVIAASIWGWNRWQRGLRRDGDIRIRFATWTERGLLVLGTAVATTAVALVFQHWNLSWSPWADAYIFVGTLAAMVAQARGWVEFWFAWIAVDLVGVPLAFTSGLPFSGLVYVVYFVLVLLGLRSWWQRTLIPTPAPTLQGVTA
ncbi:nicotinamide mononucleotide transporter family protein [Kitasatospora viridis]|uniref:Nicotinamide mononucleotide transporter n=1 Tax=Kitasatospora viridis TaxID=281105 RepID=A0A561SF19_9ACTN|nr:nicotinamide mononucleotide transporter family protein [Kitasatospora viridis]TWF73473.1 nicotinamide mononucleotide transporter [Kitasatospora viridis]